MTIEITIRMTGDNLTEIERTILRGLLSENPARPPEAPVNTEIPQPVRRQVGSVYDQAKFRDLRCELHPESRRTRNNRCYACMVEMAHRARTVRAVKSERPVEDDPEAARKVHWSVSIRCPGCGANGTRLHASKHLQATAGFWVHDRGKKPPCLLKIVDHPEIKIDKEFQC